MTKTTTIFAAAALSLVLSPAFGLAGGDQKGTQGGKSHDYYEKESSASMKMMQDDKQDQKERGQPGINSGGQVLPPDEGEQTGKPGTIFGAPATLPPQDKAPGYEGADQQMKQRESR